MLGESQVERSSGFQLNVDAGFVEQRRGEGRIHITTLAGEVKNSCARLASAWGANIPAAAEDDSRAQAGALDQEHIAHAAQSKRAGYGEADDATTDNYHFPRFRLFESFCQWPVRQWPVAGCQ